LFEISSDLKKQQSQTAPSALSVAGSSVGNVRFAIRSGRSLKETLPAMSGGVTAAGRAKEKCSGPADN
jgi:hypothetical protein